MDDKTRPDETGYRFIGKPMPRKEDARLITGKGRFTDDFNLDGQTYAVMVRSPYPHARIVAIDAAQAKGMPGVLGVFTGADCAADKLGPIPHDPVPKTKFDMKLTGPGGGAVFIGPNALLPADKARHVGEAVAMVVAETKAQALDAAEAVEVTYEELPFVLQSEDAMRPGAPVLWDEVPNNVTVETVFGNVEATDQAFARAAHVVTKNFHIGRVTGVPLEPRAALGHYDAATGRYTLYAGSGGAVRQKNELVQVLGIAPENLRVLSPDVGGNFGTRNRTFVEFGLVLWASRKIGRPVKFTATRSEAFLSDYQGRDLVTKVELALDAKHRFIAMRATNISNVGARCVSLSPLSKGSGLIPGSYAIPATTLARRGRVHQHHADQCLSQLRPAGSHFRHRAAGRYCRRAARRGSHRAAPQESRSAQSHAIPEFSRHALRQRPLRREHGLGDGDRRLERFCRAPPRSETPRQVVGPRPCQLRGVLDRRAARAGAHQGAAGRARRCGDRHAAERAGA